ncbi:ABC transporter ATP-binding protein [Sporichthya sp.]|uniref:ABC transporter ATP-binding protein n=1 Tax=Sporichthya sp. TaxID=65475 RepID=UPI0017F003AC|nr:ABC transporter ATP-binding protein [Sporichthya sp.]MBA3745169.1 ABC transporter ATP-binding protein [Sporichthya sp.]
MTLEARDLTAGYAGTTVLRGVDLVVPPSSVVALLGPNGAGKTTLLRVLSGLLTPTSGSVVLDGVDVTGESPSQLCGRGLCHVPEGRGIFPSLTVRENLVLLSTAGKEKASIERAVHAFPRLGERLGQVAGTLSGGEQQMLALARTYMQSPSVILLDEVSMGLAPRIVDDIFTFLEVLAAEGASLLLVEQYVTRALQIADYAYLLNRGSVVFAGEACELDADAIAAEYIGTGH